MLWRDKPARTKNAADTEHAAADGHGGVKSCDSYLSSRKYPGGARLSCTDSFSTPSKEGKFSCKAAAGSLLSKDRERWL